MVAFMVAARYELVDKAEAGLVVNLFIERR